MLSFLKRLKKNLRDCIYLSKKSELNFVNIKKIQTEILKLNDIQYRDILEVSTGEKKILKNSSILLKTDFPVAYESLDHLNPFGTIQDNTRSYPFFEKCRKLFGDKMSFLDLGCSGGGLVFDFALNGCLAIGLEGSDWSKKMKRANWRTIPENLFTCDISKPFDLVDSKTQMVHSFDVISCWEVMEHIPESSLEILLCNVKKHLRRDGVFVGSISKDTSDPLHVTVHDNSWWIDKFQSSGFVIDIGYSGEFEFHEFCRGVKGGIFDNCDYRDLPHLGFHFVARIL